MTDIALFYDNATGAADISLGGGIVATDDGLLTAIIVSLFTDRRALADDVLPDGGADRRGWWADDLAEIDGDQIGSRLWLLSRAKFLPAATADARDYAAEALDWLVEDGVLRSVDVVTEGIRPNMLAIGVSVVRPDGSAGRFDFVWDGTAHRLLNEVQ